MAGNTMFADIKVVKSDWKYQMVQTFSGSNITCT